MLLIHIPDGYILFRYSISCIWSPFYNLLLPISYAGISLTAPFFLKKWKYPSLVPLCLTFYDFLLIYGLNYWLGNVISLDRQSLLPNPHQRSPLPIYIWRETAIFPNTHRINKNPAHTYFPTFWLGLNSSMYITYFGKLSLTISYHLNSFLLHIPHHIPLLL